MILAIRPRSDKVQYMYKTRLLLNEVSACGDHGRHTQVHSSLQASPAFFTTNSIYNLTYLPLIYSVFHLYLTYNSFDVRTAHLYRCAHSIQNICALSANIRAFTISFIGKATREKPSGLSRNFYILRSFCTYQVIYKLQN